jgi:hypothetical protein
MTLGTEDADGGYRALPDNGDVTLVAGAQGGFHVWARMRLRDVPEGHYYTVRTASRVVDGRVVLRVPMSAQDVGAVGPDGTWEAPTALPMFMCPSPIGIPVIDTPIRYEITLTTGEGKSVAAGRMLGVPRCPSAPPELHDFCVRICSG